MSESTRTARQSARARSREDVARVAGKWPGGKPVREHPRRSTHHSPTRVYGYATVPRGEECPNGGLRAQSQTIVSTCARNELLLLEIVHEHEPRGGNVLERPGLGYALARIAAGDADGLVVAALPRLTHSVLQLARVLEWFLEFEARLIAAAPDLDTGEESGRLAVQTIIDVSKWERERLIQRTREGMRAARRKGPPGVADFPELRARIASMRSDGMTLQSIADRLNLEGVPTVRSGAKWRPSSVQRAAGYHRPHLSRTSGFLVGDPTTRSGDPAVEDLAIVRNRLGAPEMRRFGAA